MLLLDPLLLPSSWLHDEPINEQLNRAKRGGEAHCCHGDFFFFFECGLQGLSVQILFEVTFPFPPKLPKLCSPVAEEHGLSQWPQESLASLCLPLAWSLEQSNQGFGSLYTAALSISQTGSILWSG